MGYQDRINRATAYIEENLNRDIKAAEVAKEAAYSLFHFHRIFLAATGNTLKAYIRMRQMTQAGRTLIETDTRIIEIALDAGFDSQEAFTRAFKKAFGLPPGKYRRQKRHYPSVYKNRFNFNLCLKGGCAMTPVIKEKKGFKVVGIRYFGGNENNEIPGVWDDLLERADEISHLDTLVMLKVSLTDLFRFHYRLVSYYPAEGTAFLPYLSLQQHHALQKGIRSRRTSRHIDVDGNEFVHTLHDTVDVIHTTGIGT